MSKVEPNDLAAMLKRTVVDWASGEYCRIFEQTSPDEATDPYFIRALQLYGDLNPDQRYALLEVIRQVTIDTVSHVLGVLDGSSTLEGFSDEFFLALGSNRSRAINGSLQEFFLELVEEEQRFS